MHYLGFLIERMIFVTASRPTHPVKIGLRDVIYTTSGSKALAKYHVLRIIQKTIYTGPVGQFSKLCMMCDVRRMI